MRVTGESWGIWSSFVAAPASPEDYNEAAVTRAMTRLDDYIVRVKNVRPQFDAINKTELIYFKTDEEAKYYHDTEARYFREKQKLQAKMDAGEVPNNGLLHLVLLMKRCAAAEYCRRYHIVERMLKYESQGFAAVAALKHKQTIIACVKIMIEEFGISRDQISLIWGGGQTVANKKQKAKQQIMANKEKLEEFGMDVDEMLEDMELEDVEEHILQELKPEYRLSTQTPEERQREIDRFQSGRTKYCFFTFKAGGVGLSLHHTDEYSRYKVKRKQSGFAVEEDIKNCPIRPRKCIVAPTYSAIDLVQALGRCPRLTSLSNTEQILLFYGGTVEADVARVVSQKLRCLSRVVRQREKWQDVVVGAKAEDFLAPEDQVDGDNSAIYGDGGVEEEEE